MELKDLPFADVFAIRAFCQERMRFHFRMAELNPREAVGYDDKAKKWMLKMHEAQIEMLYRFGIESK